MANDISAGGLTGAQPIQVDPDALTNAANTISDLADQVRAERAKMQQSHDIAVQGWVEPISRNAYDHWFGGANEQLGQRESELRELATHLAQTAQSFRQADAADTGRHGADAPTGELVTGSPGGLRRPTFSRAQILSDPKLKAYYDGLSPDGQKAADELMARYIGPLEKTPADKINVIRHLDDPAEGADGAAIERIIASGQLNGARNYEEVLGQLKQTNFRSTALAPLSEGQRLAQAGQSVGFEIKYTGADIDVGTFTGSGNLQTAIQAKRIVYTENAIASNLAGGGDQLTQITDPGVQRIVALYPRSGDAAAFDPNYGTPGATPPTVISRFLGNKKYSGIGIRMVFPDGSVLTY